MGLPNYPSPNCTFKKVKPQKIAILDIYLCSWVKGSLVAFINFIELECLIVDNKMNSHKMLNINLVLLKNISKWSIMEPFSQQNRKRVAQKGSAKNNTKCSTKGYTTEFMDKILRWMSLCALYAQTAICPVKIYAIFRRLCNYAVG